jgi:5-methylcytosine-specific restriction endonuclease McrA
MDDDRLPGAAAIEAARECNAYLQREHRAVEAHRRTLRNQPAIERFRESKPERWTKYREGCDSRRQERIARSREGIPAEQLKAADELAASIRSAEVFECRYCHALIPPGPQRTVDHIIATMNGGKHVVENLAPACRSCNSRKNAKRRYIYAAKAAPFPIAGS